MTSVLRHQPKLSEKAANASVAHYWETSLVGRAGGAFKAANPRIEVPLLIDGEVRIFESTVIMEYLEERWPDPPLLPRDPALRAFARITEDVCDTHYEAVNWGVGEIIWYKRASGALAHQLKAEAVRQTAILQAWLTERLGTSPWFGGATFGWADAAAAPMVNRSVHYGMGPAAGSSLSNWLARLRERPSAAATFAEFDAVAGRMGDMAGAYASGERQREYYVGLFSALALTILRPPVWVKVLGFASPVFPIDHRDHAAGVLCLLAGFSALPQPSGRQRSRPLRHADGPSDRRARRSRPVNHATARLDRCAAMVQPTRKRSSPCSN